MRKWFAPLVCAAAAAAVLSSRSFAEEKKAEEKDAGPVLSHKMKGIDGKEVDLSKYQGKVVLFVNVASRCGATPQYEDLQALHAKYGKDGLAVVGVPCNQFGKQEPGTEKEIAEFCEKTYKVSFDMLAKVNVNPEKDGGEPCPLYKYLTSADAFPKDSGPVKWNFEKFLVGRDGKVVNRFRTSVDPSSEPVVKAIEAELAKK